MDDTLLNINQLIKYIDDKNIYLNHEAQEYPFNIILSSSDYYYRENFHSDIICSIFNQKEYFIEFFIDFINSFNPELIVPIIQMGMHLEKHTELMCLLQMKVLNIA